MTFSEKNRAAPTEEAAQVSQPKKVTQKEKGDRYFDTTSADGSQNSRVLDRLITVTRFERMSAKTKEEAFLSTRDFASHIETVWATSKELLPWYKAARFGDVRTAKDCLRSNANMLCCDGAEADYDAGTIPVGEAAERMCAAGVGCLVYTTPSSTDMCQKWRIFAPFSTTLPPAERARHVARINGIFDGALDGASFSISQSFYAGNITGKQPILTLLVDGRAIDLAADLDATALGRNGLPWRPRDLRPILRPRSHLPAGQAGTSRGLAMLKAACNKVAFASPGAQELTLRDAAWHVARLIAEGRVERGLAERLLYLAAANMADEPGRPKWSAGEISRKIAKAMEATA